MKREKKNTQKNENKIEKTCAIICSDYIYKTKKIKKNSFATLRIDGNHSCLLFILLVLLLLAVLEYRILFAISKHLLASSMQFNFKSAFPLPILFIYLFISFR